MEVLEVLNNFFFSQKQAYTDPIEISRAGIGFGFFQSIQ